jgi:regulator of protease activity HflC (stomatin/prohibitin superfamily)
MEHTVNLIWSLALLLVLLGISFSFFSVVPQHRLVLLGRFGSYTRTLKSGLRFRIPFIERPIKSLSLASEEGLFDITAVSVEGVPLKVTIRLMFHIQSDSSDFSTLLLHRPKSIIDKILTEQVRNSFANVKVGSVGDQFYALETSVSKEVKQTLDGSFPLGTDALRIEKIEGGEQVRASSAELISAEIKKKAIMAEAEAHRDAELIAAQSRAEALLIEAKARDEAELSSKRMEAESLKITTDSEIERSKALAEAELFSATKAAESKRLLADADSYLVQALGAVVNQAPHQNGKDVVTRLPITNRS